MKHYRMVIDANKCVGCHACEVACKQEFSAPLGFFRTVTLYLDTGEYPKVKREFLPLMCRQCEDASCVSVCTQEALFRKNGIVHVDESKCNGCGDCVKACSIGAIYLNPLTHIAEKCNLCSHRLEAGMQPACVETCISEALTLVEGDHCIPSNALPFKNDEKDKPHTLHIGANPLMKQKLKAGHPFSPLNYEIENWEAEYHG
ncbi:4Fe-4S dicluster domain-containing protein [Sulfurovum sp. ST-21]|uniref:4Fe-4S dicluster domain-containing protein n=1 Tax=Sulfurovum indicum TaxID=2779528 RepID=A0A7M1S8E4_9BACT|nr:4Fe-4S dicluster domain-containing protein [Sulfurovum indicum]QOR63009.1 4Fe-4S dicluster domain-containing protein [Sulfurovum indicum]